MGEVMLAKEYVKGIKLKEDIEYSEPPINWIMSEKFDGYRAVFSYVDGKVYLYLDQEKNIILQNGL